MLHVERAEFKGRVTNLLVWLQLCEELTAEELVFFQAGRTLLESYGVKRPPVHRQERLTQTTAS